MKERFDELYSRDIVHYIVQVAKLNFFVLTRSDVHNDVSC